MNIHSLTNDVHMHAKLAKKELKAACKLEHKAQKEHARLTKALKKGDIARAEKHSILEEELKLEASQHKGRASDEVQKSGESTYDLLAAQMRGDDSMGYHIYSGDKNKRRSNNWQPKDQKLDYWKRKSQDDKAITKGWNYDYPSNLKIKEPKLNFKEAGNARW
eukprot:Phypoly_transcript_19133.p1 GENE.Phypoly_transcript_19133~~Phypoly_transcript_19133.p1  ORF type:complete len:163 (-),score=32.51 Phypoly_transcript_19133:152-640(-)